MMKKVIDTLFFLILLLGSVHAAPTHLVDEKPVLISEVEDSVYLIDFGRVAFGNVRVVSPAAVNLTIHFGEDLKNGRVNRKPLGTVRYKAAEVHLKANEVRVVAPSKDGRNTSRGKPPTPPAVLTPKEWGVVLPFRWVEIEGWEGELKPAQIVRQSAFSATWDNDAAAFDCSDEMLNRVWELCRYSIKATTFAGVYVDGDRERIPYEADAYLNQLSHYYTDNDIQMARDTLAHLFKNPTWPTEWAPHMVFMVHADWMQTGETEWVRRYYEILKSKTLAERRAGDGLIASASQDIKRTDIVDWPIGERDAYVFTSRNTVVNAFYLQSIRRMEELARALGKDDEAEVFKAEFDESYAAFQQTFFDTETGLFMDGVGTKHSSQHANLFSLAFGLAPDEVRESMAAWLVGRGMRCSVYAAQYLLEGLFESGASEEALSLMVAEGDRSWRHMVERGATITWEAWDHKYKPNQDWNHAWGAAPANLLPRYVLGVQALSPGWVTAHVRPSVSGLKFAKGKVPTPHGPIVVDWANSDNFKMELTLPKGVLAKVELPAFEESDRVYCDGRLVQAKRIGSRWVIDELAEGTMRFVVTK
ncbi:family 78 glycoside hydrolase catalytic domain [Rubritalea spongiae]|uniref:alpha-L-rhamnosidase n=1 Tax=Rubritalea spongiae TaxID=430797 RepID=A0ABW5DZD1_9BACT